jgi:hypothetical protein
MRQSVKYWAFVIKHPLKLILKRFQELSKVYTLGMQAYAEKEP